MGFQIAGPFAHGTALWIVDLTRQISHQLQAGFFVVKRADVLIRTERGPIAAYLSDDHEKYLSASDSTECRHAPLLT